MPTATPAAGRWLWVELSTPGYWVYDREKKRSVWTSTVPFVRGGPAPYGEWRWHSTGPKKNRPHQAPPRRARAARQMPQEPPPPPPPALQQQQQQHRPMPPFHPLPLRPAVQQRDEQQQQQQLRVPAGRAAGSELANAPQQPEVPAANKVSGLASP